MAEISLENIICRPIITEKSAQLQQGLNVHVFEVDRRANKAQIKQVIEKLFNVKVKTVRTMIMPSKLKRYGRQVGRMKAWKKAMIVLAEGQTFEVLET